MICIVERLLLERLGRLQSAGRYRTWVAVDDAGAGAGVAGGGEHGVDVGYERRRGDVGPWSRVRVERSSRLGK
jgi:hypothetical protein